MNQGAKIRMGLKGRFEKEGSKVWRFEWKFEGRVRRFEGLKGRFEKEGSKVWRFEWKFERELFEELIGDVIFKHVRGVTAARIGCNY